MTSALVIGLDHSMQRPHIDETAADADRRQRFSESLRGVMENNGVQLVAEEAGDDREVAAALQREQNAWNSYFSAPPQTVEPQETVARRVVKEVEELRGTHIDYVDIRPPGQKTNAVEYEAGMLDTILKEVCAATAVLILCGEDHREALTELLGTQGWCVKSHTFEWLLATA